MKKRRWLIAAMLSMILLAVFLETAVVGYQFSALLCLGIAGVTGIYLMLSLLAGKCPGLVRGISLILTGCLTVGAVAAAVTGSIIVRAAAGQRRDCAYVVVLGAGVNGTEPSLSLRNRIDAAYDYLTAYPTAICVVSGGQGTGEQITEASCMQRELVARGIASSRIWMEDAATNTRENIRFSLDLIEKKTGDRPTEIGLISSEYHLYRAGLLAKAEGVNACGIPAKTTWITLRVNYYLREIAAVWYYTVLGG